jgi:GNAT superfamily N-acetyltransferase
MAARSGSRGSSPTRPPFAWICDVFVDESVRGRGVGKRLMAAIVEDPRLEGLKRMMLATRDAHGLYAGFGFTPLDHPDLWMVRASPEAPAGPGGPAYAPRSPADDR